MVPFRAPLGALLGTFGLTPRSLGALWGSLWSFGSDLSLRSKASKVWVLDHLGTARAPLYSFWGVFGAREASSWALLGARDSVLGLPWRSLGALLCIFDVFGGSLDVGSVTVLFGGGAICDPYTPAHVS